LATLQAIGDAIRPDNAGTTQRTTRQGVGAPLADKSGDYVNPITGVRSAGRGFVAQTAAGGGTAADFSGISAQPQDLAAINARAQLQGLAFRKAFPERPRPPAPSVTNNNTRSSKTEVNVNFNGPVDRQQSRGLSREVERGVRQALREERRKVATGVGN